MDDDSATRSARTRCATRCSRLSAVVVGIAVLIFLGTTIMVHALGLERRVDSPGPRQRLAVRPAQAAAHHGAARARREDREPGPVDEPERVPDDGATGDIELRVSPLMATPDGAGQLHRHLQGCRQRRSCEVQRFENGKWSNFGVQARRCSVGTFATYIMTGRTGENRFRVFDPQTKKGSNVILVTID